jgi:acyl carrier protein
LEQFVNEVSAYLDLEVHGLEVDRPLEELGIDSLGQLELIIMLEDFAGHEMPEELWYESMTLGEIYSTYETYASRDQREVKAGAGEGDGNSRGSRLSGPTLG